MTEISDEEDYESAEEPEIEDENSSRDATILDHISDNSIESYSSAQREKARNLLAYWFLGMTNNFGYVIMLSAAHDILSHSFSNNTQFNNGTSDAGDFPVFQNGTNNPRDCNFLSTGTILLADIIPALVIKVMAPFFPLYVHFRIGAVVILCSISFLLVGLAISGSMAILGVVFASASAGLGEATFLAYSANYHEDVISTWSSGTGGAGLFGALSYAALTSLGLTPQQTILFMLVIPMMMSVSFWQLLEHVPRLTSCRSLLDAGPSCQYEPLGGSIGAGTRHLASPPPLSFERKLRLLPSLAKFMVPLSAVYAGEYFINQGLSELLYFKSDSSWISHDEQYRWYQVLYQVGVLISRSSVNLVYIRRIWITAVLQWLNVVLFLTGAIFLWMGSIWLVFVLILWEGLLGGAAYVNTFYRLSKEVAPHQKEFALQATTFSDTLGITIAGFIAIPVHNAICRLPLP